MTKRILFPLALLAAACAPPAAAQGGLPGWLSVSPVVAYGLYGELPDDGPTLGSELAIGGRAAFQFSPQWAVYGSYLRATPGVEEAPQADATVDHWSAGIEFAYVPRGGAEGMLPILLEVGLGQARYEFEGVGAGVEGTRHDLAVSLGLASAIQLWRHLALRYGVSDYLSSFNDQGVANHVFLHVGAEVTF